MLTIIGTATYTNYHHHRSIGIEIAIEVGEIEVQCEQRALIPHRLTYWISNQDRLEGYNVTNWKQRNALCVGAYPVCVSKLNRWVYQKRSHITE